MHGVKPMNEEEKKPESVTEKKQSNDKFAIAVSVFLILLIIGIAVANILGYVSRWEWVGVVDRKTGEIKTLWDWMNLLLVPFVLAAGAYLFNKSEKAHERKIAEQQRENERVLAAKRAEAELEISKDKQQQTALESYFDKMTDLLLDKGLRTSGEDDEVRTIARTRTLTVLRGLDGNRRGQVLQFLYEAGLITGQNPIIDLSFADLRKIDLPYANLENANLSKANLRKANIGFVFQSFNLIDELTVYENVELPLLYLKYSSSERKKRVNEVLEQMKIMARRNHFPQQLSGGQQQRVAVARAVVARPKLILADEPTGNLDSLHGEEVMRIIGELNEAGTTIVMVTHSPTYAEYAHRIIHLFDGHIVSENVQKEFRL